MALAFGGTWLNGVLNRMLGITSSSPPAPYLSNSTMLLDIYSGTAPGVSAAATGVHLVSGFAVNGITWNAPSGGIAALASSVSLPVAATGTAGYFRIRDTQSSGFGDATTGVIMQGTVGTVSSGADMILASTSLTSGTPVNLTNFTLTQALSNGTMYLSDSMANAILTLIISNTNMTFGVGPQISIYSGSSPTSGNASPTGTLLMQVNTGFQMWNSASGNAATLNAGILSGYCTGSAAGTVGYAQIQSASDVTQQLYCTAGVSGTDVILGSNTMAASVANNITAATIQY